MHIYASVFYIYCISMYVFTIELTKSLFMLSNIHKNDGTALDLPSILVVKSQLLKLLRESKNASDIPIKAPDVSIATSIAFPSLPLTNI